MALIFSVPFDMVNYFTSLLGPWRTEALMIVIIMICMLLFGLRSEFSPNPPDKEFWNTLEQLKKTFGSWSYEGIPKVSEYRPFLKFSEYPLFQKVSEYRPFSTTSNIRFYAITEVTLDLIFPISYGLFLAIFIVQVFPEDLAKYLVFVPLLASLCDLIENISLAWMAWNFKTSEKIPGLLAELTFVFTKMKFVLLIVAFVFLFASLIFGRKN
jgi:hypothetical protein